MKSLQYIRCLIAVVAVSLTWVGCASGDPPDKQNGADPKATNSKAADTADHLFDPLMKGDQIQIDLRGIPVKIEPVVQNIAQDGTITLENIGPLSAAGLTPKQLQESIHDKYVPSIYTRITVTVTPLRRYFYVSGEINNKGGSGRQSYNGNITLTQAIAAAGDFTDYADKRHVRLTRMSDGKSQVYDCKKILSHKAPDPLVAPGDQIYIRRRIF